ncbi:MAG: gamma-glutamyltransferase [Xanthomonadales bacterium]|nr:gamma-glutamyltransferase [Gammaproteobacteria bacterium]NNE04156.1 gamma-glutamyltransferase [Xanthomonadales bacterium]NNL94344.1 gamma-glutamyltransferase [Xanthomonadales bacterium]
MLTESTGIAASGHAETSKAAVRLLESGGNAFDAALGAMCAACVAEPMLASLGGGGFLMALQAGSEPVLHDFFVQTPAHKKPAEDIDFYPILADFGTATQEFHIGMGSMAVPGVVAGLFNAHHLCRLPVSEIVAPAVDLAREGVRITAYQSEICHILKPILEASPEAMQLVATAEEPGAIADEGSVVRNPDMAETLEALAQEGPDLFYRGELARHLVRDSEEQGGMLQLDDLSAYRVAERKPVFYTSHGARFAFNSPPSPSGCLLAFALTLIESRDLADHRWGHEWHGVALAETMRATSKLRRELGVDRHLSAQRVAEILDPDHVRSWRESLRNRALFSRGTTQISVADKEGNLASLTVSNGEGCSYVLPGTGIMMNNMLGEEDLNPDGFHNWSPGIRMASMMCPSVAILPGGGRVALGSGGSNRIRSALLQVLINLFEFRMPLLDAVAAPRLHLERDHLSIEHGFEPETIRALQQGWPDHRLWPEPNMFFGGVHAVVRHPDGRFDGAGDPRRFGAVALAGAG